MREEMGKEGKYSLELELNEMDRKIMRALSDELSEVKVSEELIAATLCAAGEQKKKAGQKKRGFRLWGGALTAAAALLLIVLGIGGFGRSLKATDGELSGGMTGAREPVQNGAPYIKAESANPGMDGEGNFADMPKAEPNNGFSDMNGAGYFAENPSDGMDGSSFCEGQDVGSGAAEDFDEWLYQELLAAFDEKKPQADFEGRVEEPAETMENEAVRSILWQRDERALSCVIYAQDYRIEALLEENGTKQKIVLTDWAYARELWELAGEP